MELKMVAEEYASKISGSFQNNLLPANTGRARPLYRIETSRICTAEGAAGVSYICCCLVVYYLAAVTTLSSYPVCSIPLFCACDLEAFDSVQDHILASRLYS